MTDNTNTDKLNAIYLRAGVAENEPAHAMFTFRDVPCVLYVQSDGTLVVHKLGKDGEATPKAIATGKWYWSDNPGTNREGRPMPNLTGLFVTGAKKTVFEVAGWLHHDEEKDDKFVSLNITPKLERKGFFPGQAAA